MSTMTDTRSESGVKSAAPREARSWVERGEAVIVDVREPFERASEWIEGSEHQPLGKLDPRSLPAADEMRVVFQCRSGKRSLKAAERYLGSRGGEAYNLEGGLLAWKDAGLPVARGDGGPRIDVMRQVQIVAGSLVLLGVLLGAFVNPWFLLLAGFIGAGLTFAGLSGWCGMAMLLGKAPWNRPGGASRGD
jgi:rhodanese-related sulfurtransferase